MADILIDLGPAWGHIIPLRALGHISHIEYSANNRIIVQCDFPKKDKREPLKFSSRECFSSDELEVERQRLLGFSCGIVSREDMMTIIKSMELQTGVSIEEKLNEPLYDMEFVRRIWASIHDEPYFRFVMQYDGKTKQVAIDESHNEDFTEVLHDWMDETTLHVVSDRDEQLLLFAYEVLYKMAEPLLLEPEDGLFMDPDANIPTMAVKGPTQTVDLAKIGEDQIAATLRGNR